MKTSMKSFAALVVAVGISAANTALASGRGSQGSSSHGSSASSHRQGSHGTTEERREPFEPVRQRIRHFRP